MFDRDWKSEAERRIEGVFEVLCASLQQPIAPGGLRVTPPLAMAEAKYFVLGLETRLFELHPNGYVQSSMLPTGVEADPHTVFQIFAGEPPPPRLRRRAVWELSVAAALVLE